MKNLSLIILKIFLFISLLSLLGCNAPLTATPTAGVPTIDPLVIAGTVSAAKTEAVQTVVAQMTEAATLTPLATETPLPTEADTLTPAPPAPLPTLAPKYGESLTEGADFDLAVTLKNIGTKDWSSDNIDFKYLSGSKFQKKVNAIDLPKSVDTGDSIHLVVDMVASTGTGTKDASWGLVNSGTTFCTVNIHVNVK